MTEWLPCKIKLSKNEVPPVPIAGDSKVIFPISNHSYEAITNEIFNIINKTPLTHQTLSDVLLLRLKFM